MNMDKDFGWRSSEKVSTKDVVLNTKSYKY